MTDLYSLEKVVHRCWTEDAFKDFTLESKDGEKVPATRVVIAARSEVFEKLLLSEKKEDVVKVDLDGAVLKAVVEYCYTDGAEIMKWEGKVAASIPDEKFIPTLFRLQAAAAEWKLPGLTDAIGHSVTSYLNQFPTLCFGGYQAWTQLGPEAASPELGEILLEQIRSTNYTKLKPSSLTTLSSKTVQQILQDKQMQATELELFQLLKMWVESMPGSLRKSEAMDLVDHINLHDIAPAILSTEVASSGLVTPDHLMEAYKNQALAAASETPVKFERRRYSVQPVWRHTMTNLSSPEQKQKKWVADVLEYPPITTGRYGWTVEIVSVEPDEMMFAWLGISSTAFPFKATAPLDAQEGCWAVNDRCRGMHLGATAFADFDTELTEGHRLIFSLDLTPEEENRGTLDIRVEGNGTPPHSLGMFTNLLDHLEEHPGSGFVPAMSTRECCVVRAIDIPKSLD